MSIHMVEIISAKQLKIQLTSLDISKYLREYIELLKKSPLEQPVLLLVNLQKITRYFLLEFTIYLLF